MDPLEKQEEKREKVLEMVRASFRPEFLNRLDDLVVFSALGTEELARIAQLQIDRARQAARRPAAGRWRSPPDALAWLADEGNDPAYGARPAAPPRPDGHRRPARTRDPLGRGAGRRHGAGRPCRGRPDRGHGRADRWGRAAEATAAPGADPARRTRPAAAGCHDGPAHGRGWRNPYEGKFTVSIDPSSIPNFGGQSPTRRSQVRRAPSSPTRSWSSSSSTRWS